MDGVPSRFNPVAARHARVAAARRLTEHADSLAARSQNTVVRTDVFLDRIRVLLGQRPSQVHGGGMANIERVRASLNRARVADDLPRTVLVVDADPDAREMYCEALASQGLEVVSAADGREGLVRLHQAKPDAIVVDSRLPFIDGAQFCALVRRDPATAGLCMVTITSDTAPDRVARIRASGADVVLTKPVSLEVLAAAVLRHAAEQKDEPAETRPAEPAATLRRIPKVRARERYVTDRPPLAPRQLRCPLCDCDLQYDRSHIGGVSDRHPEQWDSFVCAKHGVFQYRHRTRKLRRLS